MEKTAPGNFHDALHFVNELMPDSSGGLISNQCQPTLAELLHIKYRILLGRSADAGSISLIEKMSDAHRLMDLACSLESEEFHVDIFRSIDRLRRQYSRALSWHFHLPRTAGSKFVADWRANDRFAIQLPLHGLKLPNGWKRVAEALLAFAQNLQLNKEILVTGHIKYRDVDRWIQSGDVIYATLRHPVARAVSLYRYAVLMCQKGEVASYPASATTRAHFEASWRETIKACGLDPDSFRISEFIAAGLCPDNQIAQMFGQFDHVEELASYMRHNSFNVIFQEEISKSTEIINGSGCLDFEPASQDVAWLTDYYRRDIRHFESIRREFQPTSRHDCLAAVRVGTFAEDSPPSYAGNLLQMRPLLAS